MRFSEKVQVARCGTSEHSDKKTTIMISGTTWFVQCQDDVTTLEVVNSTTGQQLVSTKMAGGSAPIRVENFFCPAEGSWRSLSLPRRVGIDSWSGLPGGQGSVSMDCPASSVMRVFTMRNSRDAEKLV